MARNLRKLAVSAALEPIAVEGSGEMHARLGNGTRIVTATAVAFSVCLMTDIGICANAIPMPISLPLTGQVPDISYRIRDSQFGIEFQTKFQDVSYQGEVTGAAIEQEQAGKLTLWFSIRNLKVTHKKTSLTGWPGTAQVGPMDLHLGNRRDLWIAFDLERAVRNGQPRIVLRGTRFRLPKDNWSIGRPKWIRTTGVAMTKQRVESGLRNGLVENQRLLEKQVMQMASKVLRELFQTVPDTVPGKKELVDEVQRRLMADAKSSVQPNPPPQRSTTSSSRLPRR